MKLGNSLTADSRQQILQKLLVLVIGGVLTIAGQKIIWPTITKSALMLREWLYRLLAGHRVFHWWAIKRYRSTLLRTAGRLSNPWLPESTSRLEDLFVPVRVSPTDLPLSVRYSHKYEDSSDIRDVIANLRRFVLIGEPGAGKSTTLQSLAIALARGELSIEPNPLPILIELKHFARTPTLALDAYITSVLTERYHFPKAAAFLQRQLNTGYLQVLLDGLDEVGSAQLQTVTNAIIEFGITYPDLGLIVTCRAASYSGELFRVVTATVSMADFNRSQIRKLVSAWSFPQGKSDIELIEILRQRPTILALCKNPLMLTIVVSLYARGYRLPQARVDFFTICAHAFLEEWDQFRSGILRTNRYDRIHKERVLQQLALYKQNDALQPTDFTMHEIREIISNLLPTLGIPASESEQFLNELVVNSSLIIRSGADQLRFSHLAFQEYFAAREVDQFHKATYLLSRLIDDPNRWREVTLLYCGMSVNITSFVEALALRDLQLTGLTIVDAKSLDATVADGVIRRLQDAVVKRNDAASLTTLTRIAAQEGRTWSATALTVIHQIYANGDSNQRWSLIEGLLSTGTVVGASLLAPTLAQAEGQRRFLESIPRIGESSLPALREVLSSRAIYEHVAAFILAVCAKIGTPEATLMLVPFLQAPEESYRLAAAISAAQLISDAENEATLHFAAQKHRFKDLSGSSLRLTKWVWPVPTVSKSGDVHGMTLVAAIIVDSITSACGRNSDCLKEFIGNDTPQWDLRLGIPILIELVTQGKDPSTVGPFAKLFESLSPISWVAGADVLKKAWTNLPRDWRLDNDTGIRASFLGFCTLAIYGALAITMVPSAAAGFFSLSLFVKLLVGALCIAYAIVVWKKYWLVETYPDRLSLTSSERMLQMLYEQKLPFDERETMLLYQSDLIRQSMFFEGEEKRSSAQKYEDPWVAFKDEWARRFFEPLGTALNPRRSYESLRLMFEGLRSSLSIITAEDYFRACLQLSALRARPFRAAAHKAVGRLPSIVNYLAVVVFPLCVWLGVVAVSRWGKARNAPMALEMLLVCLLLLPIDVGCRLIASNRVLISFKHRNLWVTHFRRRSIRDLHSRALAHWLDITTKPSRS